MQQRADTLVPTVPSTSGSCKLSGIPSVAKRKRGQSDSDDDADDSDDEEEESWEKRNKSDEVVPSQARREEAMDAGRDGDEGKTAERKEDTGNVGDGEERGCSDGDELVGQEQEHFFATEHIGWGDTEQSYDSGKHLNSGVVA